MLPALLGSYNCLEGEPGSELARECPWQRAACGVDEPDRVPKTRRPDDVTEVVTVISMVCQVESLECKLQVPVFSQLDVLSYARVHVKVRIAAK